MFTLNVDHPDVSPKSSNYSIDSLRPAAKSIISIAASGEVVSYFFHDMWDLTPYASRIERLHFEIEQDHEDDALWRANKETWKRVMFWTMYGLRVPVAISSICGMHQAFRYVVKLCTKACIRVDQLKRFPRVYRDLSKVPPSQWWALRTMLARLEIDRSELGFEILGASELAEIGRKIPRHVHEQTAFIPERIYFYVLNRCEAIIGRYLEKRDEFEKLYRTCSDAYAQARRDFGPTVQIGRLREQQVAGKIVYQGALELYAGGSFAQLATALGVLETIEDLSSTKRAIGTQQLGSYLTSVALASRIVIAAYSAARDEEHGSLLRHCLEVRDDAVLGRAYLICGKTNKTTRDSRAYWTAAEPAKRAVSAAAAIAMLRASEAKKNPKYRHKVPPNDLLFPRVTDPWIGRTDVLESLKALNVSANPRSTLCVVLRGLKRLFDATEMTIRDEDLEQALRMNPDLSRTRFAVGKHWPLAWHQFRRTLVCHAAGAGVSLASTAWQLKHVGPWMAQHYRNNYFNLKADPDLADEFARTQVEVLLIRTKELAGNDFVPLAKEGKAVAIRLISTLEEKALKEAAQNRRCSIRDTAAGLCTNPDACPFGGWENVAECVKCPHGFAMRSKRPLMVKMQSLVQSELLECGKSDVDLAQSLKVQLVAIEELLDVTK